MLLSVVIPTYNRCQLLQVALESVFAQTFTDYEVIVVDDGSTDGTREWLALPGQRLRVVSQSNRGPGAARNLGVAEARGEYVAFLDSDDLWFLWTLETYASVIQSCNHPAFVAGKPFRFRDGDDLSDVPKEAIKSKRFADYLASDDEWRWWGVSSFVVRTEVIRSCGGFAAANINGEDADLALKLGDEPGFVQILSPSTFAYREHDANLTLDLNKTVSGMWYKVRSEQAGLYPGSDERSRERWRILTRHIRPVALECLRKQMRREAWELYGATFRWHFTLRRWKFLLGFPLKAFCSHP